MIKCTHEEYLDIDALSRSSFNALRISPRKYRFYNEAKESKAMSLGTAIHEFISDPSAFNRDYVLAPEGMHFGRKEGIAFKNANSDKKIIKHEDWVHVNEMASSILSHPIIGPTLPFLQKEMTYVWYDEELGVKCKVRFDAVGMIEEIPIVWDWKSTRTLSKRKRQYLIKDHGLDIQECLYHRAACHIFGMNEAYFRFAWVQNLPPYDLIVQRLPVERKLGVWEELKQLAKEYNQCVSRGEWPSRIDPYEEEILDVPLTDQEDLNDDDESFDSPSVY